MSCSPFAAPKFIGVCDPVEINPMVKTTVKMTNHPDAILVTLSQQTIKDRRGGLRQILREWQASDGENLTWWYRTGTMPKHLVIWVYWVIGGRVRWKSKLLMIEENRTFQFSGRSEPMYGKTWLGLFDFEPIPRRQQISVKGFQGFRYFDHESIFGR